MIYYLLDQNNIPTPCSLRKWSLLYETKAGLKRRQIAFDEIDGYSISTVFLGIDHNFWGGTPLLFETMIFPKEERKHRYCERYATYIESEEGHRKAMNWVFDGCKEDSE